MTLLDIITRHQRVNGRRFGKAHIVVAQSNDGGPRASTIVLGSCGFSEFICFGSCAVLGWGEFGG
jgi:hypothetical protein